MLAELKEEINIILDELQIKYPGQFPDGPDFLKEFEDCMKTYVENGVIDDWVLSPKSDDGFKVTVISDQMMDVVLRTEDGGKIE